MRKLRKLVKRSIKSSKSILLYRLWKPIIYSIYFDIVGIFDVRYQFFYILSDMKYEYWIRICDR